MVDLLIALSGDTADRGILTFQNCSKAFHRNYETVLSSLASSVYHEHLSPFDYTLLLRYAFCKIY